MSKFHVLDGLYCNQERIHRVGFRELRGISEYMGCQRRQDVRFSDKLTMLTTVFPGNIYPGTSSAMTLMASCRVLHVNTEEFSKGDTRE